MARVPHLPYAYACLADTHVAEDHDLVTAHSLALAVVVAALAPLLGVSVQWHTLEFTLSLAVHYAKYYIICTCLSY